MNNLEKLAVLTALEKAIKDAVKEVRIEANTELLEMNDALGVDKVALRVGEVKVGEFIVTYHADGFAITDKQAFEEFAVDYGMASVARHIRPDMEQSAIKFLESTLDPDVFAETVEERINVSPDWEKGMTRGSGCVLYMDTALEVPGVEYRPKTLKATMVRGCKPSDVLPLLRELPGGIDAALLGDGNE